MSHLEGRDCIVQLPDNLPSINSSGQPLVEYLARETVLIRPYSEDNDPCYKFRLDAVVENHGSDPIEMKVIIEWYDKEFMQYRDEIFLKHNDSEWNTFKTELCWKK